MVLERQRSTVNKLDASQRFNSTQGAQLTELTQRMYSIVLYNTETDETYSYPGLDPGGRTDFAEYFFRVPPKVHEFEEPFATTIQSTQDGGKYVESYGSILKSIRISGTTGLRPNKVTSPQVIPFLSINENQLNTLIGQGLNTNIRTIPATEKTGHDDIMFLRNIFRRYSDLKAYDALAGRVVMLWRNIKDSDYWIVEPEDFRLSQNSSSPLTYEYHIALKTLGKFDYTYAIPPDPLEERRRRERLLSRLQEYSQNILNIFLSLSTNITQIAGFVNFATGLLLSPLTNILNGLNAVKTASFSSLRSLRSQFDSIRSNIDTAIQQLVDIPSDIETLFDDKPRLQTVNDLRRLSVFIDRLRVDFALSINTPQADTADAVERYAAVYDAPGTLTTPRRSPESATYIGRETAPARVATGTVERGEDIRAVAERLLGDRSRWRLLVVLNRLRSPFIATVPSPGILAPGDPILYPTTEISEGLVGTQNPSA
ncbi:hypothetical protein HC928_00440 [bacterium]|nr:hypothetical protein [bacterium]